jgi:hypothetical protein
MHACSNEFSMEDALLDWKNKIPFLFPLSPIAKTLFSQMEGSSLI